MIVKKIKVLLAVFAVITMLFTCAFAAGEDISISATLEGEYATVSMDAASDITLMGFSSFWMSYNAEVWDFVEATSLYTDFTAVTATDGDTYINIAYNQMPANGLSISKSTNLVTLKFKLKSGKSAYGTTFGTHTNGMIDQITFNYLTVGSATIASPVVVSANTSTTIEAGDATYTDVVNFDSSLTNVTATNPTLKFDLYEDGTKHKSYSVALGNGVTLEGGTLSFKIAVIGAPADKAITLVNPAIAE